MAENKKTVKELISENSVKLTKAEITALKKKYECEDIYQVTVVKKKVKHIAWLRDRSNDMEFMEFAMDRQGHERRMFCLDNMMIKDKSDPAFENDTKIRISGGLEAVRIVDILEGEVVKH